ncbi:MAG: hypothetical protein H6742_21685 [Alphaproteobacteria bacterium]|nr:hypothetical protein [Alphaproteobacteria bacterium]
MHEPAAVDRKPGSSLPLRKGSAPQAVSDALRAMARLVRSFSLYDLRNQTVIGFLTEFRTAMREALDAHGRIELVVRPFEFVYHDQVVYLERDRERSLAFRLFRDGVRKLTIEPGASWEEQVRLLEVVGILSTGLTQHEDDLVTLFWKSDFQGISIEAVDGFVSDDVTTAIGGGTASTPRPEGPLAPDIGRAEVPRDWDLPIPAVLEPAAIKLRTIPMERIHRLQDEADTEELPDLCMRLVDELIDLIQDPVDPTGVVDVAHVFAEIRDYYLGEGDMASVVELLRRLSPLQQIDAERIGPVLAGFVGTRTVAGVLELALRPSAPDLREIRAMLTALPGEHDADILLYLLDEPDPVRQRILADLAATWARDRPARLLSAVPSLPALATRRIAVAILRDAPQQTVDLGLVLLGRSEDDLRAEGIRLLDGAPVKKAHAERLLALLDHPDAAVRVVAIERLARLAVPAHADALLRRLQQPGVAAEEAATIGVALCSVAPERFEGEMVEWTRPRSLWKRLFQMPKDTTLQFAAVSGLASLDLARHGELIRWLSKRSGSELSQHCVRVLTDRSLRAPTGAHGRLDA